MGVRINFADYVERKRAEGIDIEMPDGPPITIPPAELWIDATFVLMGQGDFPGAGAAILGAEQWARFVAEGGNWRVLNGLIGEAEGVTLGESEASSTSSETTARPSNPTSPAGTDSTSTPTSEPTG